MTKQLLFSLLILVSISTKLIAQETEVPQTDNLATKIQNPVADLISIPLQNNFDFGKDIRPTNTLNIQPVYPFSLGKNINFITRTIIPIISAPIGNDRANGIGNVTFSVFFTPAKASKITWGVGPTIMFPTIEKGLGFDKLGLAPSGALIYQNKRMDIRSNHSKLLRSCRKQQ